MLKRRWRQAARALRKPPRVLLVRGAQELRLALMQRTGGWQRLDAAIRERWTPERVARLAAARPWVLFAADADRAFRAAAADGRIDAEALVQAARNVAERRFRILGAELPRQGPWPWRVDWRHGHEWRQAYWASFDHYAPRAVPYDVKFPWELGRLQFLVPLLQGAVLAPQEAFLECALEILADWCRDNPYGHSVNWYPMEASMRTVALVMALDMARAAGASAEQQRPLIVEIDRNASFVWRTVEDTDIRGNHYTANLAALMAAGRALAPQYPAAGAWLRYGADRLDREILEQVLPDGVNFEKSTAYHRLVTDLFLLMASIARDEGRQLSEAARERLRRACHFTRAYLRPDGRAPLIGDNDDAVVFAMDALAVRDHRSTLAVGGALFGDDVLLRESGGPLPSAVWLFADEALRAPDPAPLPPKSAWYREGGFAVVNEEGAYLLVDLGEVGLRGRGGHGHNDILSFELVIGGIPVVIDPGTYLYSGDPSARLRLRGSAAHNALVIDDQEIAPFGKAPFRIEPVALPLEAEMACEDGVWLISGGHAGYRRLADAADHFRTFRFRAEEGSLEIEDRVETAGRHRIKRYLHFPPSASVELTADGAVLAVEGLRLHISWSGDGRAAVDTSEVCEGFGVSAPAPVLCVEDAVDGLGRLTLTLRRLDD